MVITEKRRRHNRKYNSEEVCYQAKVVSDRIPVEYVNRPILTIQQVLHRLFTNILSRIRENLQPDDLIRLCLFSDKLDKPISTNLCKVSDMTVEKILSTVIKVLQSKEEVSLEDGFCVEIITIQRPIGGGKTNRMVSNIMIDRNRKKSVIAIEMDETNICCAKAILTAKALAKKNLSYFKLLRDRRRPNALVKGVLDLHRNSGVEIGPCGLEEIKKFASFLNLHIAVVSADNLNQVKILKYVYLNIDFIYLK